MKNIKKNVFQALVIIALFSSSIFADGEMGGGGRPGLANDNAGTKPAVILTTEEDGEMGGGGLAADPDYLESVIRSIYDYFDWNM
jgi:hypothetical protein